MGVSKSKDAKIVEQALQAQFGNPGQSMFPNPANAFVQASQQQQQQPGGATNPFQAQAQLNQQLGAQLNQQIGQMQQMPPQMQLSQQLSNQLAAAVQHQQHQQQQQQQHPPMQQQQPMQQAPMGQPMQAQAAIAPQGFGPQPSGFPSFPPFPAMPQQTMGNMQFANMPALPPNAIFPSNTSSAFPVSFANQQLKPLIPGYAPPPDRRGQLMPQQSHDHEQNEFTSRGYYVEQQVMPQMQGMPSKSRKHQQQQQQQH